MSRSIGLVLVAGLVLGLLAACGGGSGGSQDDVGGGGADASGELSRPLDGGDTGTSPLDVLPDVPVRPLDLAFQIAFTYIGRVAENEGKSDLFVLSPAGGDPRSVTNFIEGEQGESWSCENSCVVDDALQWLAVATGPRGESGFFSFGMGRFTEEGVVQMAKASPLQDVVDLHFSEEWVYYSRLVDNAGGPKQYEIWRAELASPVNREKILDFPPPDALDLSQYAGRFHVNPAADQVVLLLPTLRSQSVYLWQDGRLAQLDFICPIMAGGRCEGTGSAYSDGDPVAFTRDGRWLTVFATGALETRILLYDLEANPPVAYFKDLAKIPAQAGTYVNRYCEYLEPWQYGLVVGQPVFAPGSDALYFIGKKDCGSAKPVTDILRLSLDRLRAFEALGEGDLYPVTSFPQDGSAGQVVVNNLSVSPGGDVVVFTGTPTYDQNGMVITEGSSRHRNDSELWMVGADGSQMQQLTEELRWFATAPKALPE